MIAVVALMVFALGFALDFADTMHKVAVERRNGHAAGAWSATMYALSTVGTWAVLDVAGWLVAPGAVGYYLGSVYAMRAVSRRELPIPDRSVDGR